MGLVENIFCKDSVTDAEKRSGTGAGIRLAVLVQSMGSSKIAPEKKEGYDVMRRKILIIFLLRYIRNWLLKSQFRPFLFPCRNLRTSVFPAMNRKPDPCSRPWPLPRWWSNKDRRYLLYSMPKRQPTLWFALFSQMRRIRATVLLEIITWQRIISLDCNILSDENIRKTRFNV